MHEYTTKYVGMDVHKETIAVATAQEGRSEPVYEHPVWSSHLSHSGSIAWQYLSALTALSVFARPLT